MAGKNLRSGEHMKSILVKELVEYNYSDLFHSPDLVHIEDALMDKSDEIKRSLGLRMQPIELHKKAGKKKIKFTGIAGVVSFRNLEIEIMPKFLKEDDSWRESLFHMIYWSKNSRLFSQKSSHISKAHFSFYDHVALMFYDTMRLALGNDRIHTYHPVEENSRYLKGRLLFDRQIQNIITHPGILYYEYDSFDTDNEFNYLLLWCLNTLCGKVQNDQIKSRLKSLSEEMPKVTKKYNIPVESGLPPQYFCYREPIDIANTLATGYSSVHSSRRGMGIGYVVNMEVIYEKFVEKILKQLKAASYDLKSEPQSSRIFAKAVSPDTSSYYTVPDNKLYKDGVPALLIDAKYKNIYADERQKKPVNSDIYQLFASMITHECRKGILISPCESSTPVTEHSWVVYHSGEKYELFSLTVDMSDLSSMAKIERLKGNLLTCLDKKLV